MQRNEGSEGNRFKEGEEEHPLRLNKSGIFSVKLPGKVPKSIEAMKSQLGISSLTHHLPAVLVESGTKDVSPEDFLIIFEIPPPPRESPSASLKGKLGRFRNRNSSVVLLLH